MLHVIDSCWTHKDRRVLNEHEQCQYVFWCPLSLETIYCCRLGRRWHLGSVLLILENLNWEYILFWNSLLWDNLIWNNPIQDSPMRD